MLIMQTNYYTFRTDLKTNKRKIFIEMPTLWNIQKVTLEEVSEIHRSFPKRKSCEFSIHFFDFAYFTLFFSIFMFFDCLSTVSVSDGNAKQF